MFKYTQQTAGFTENNWDPALELSTLDYMFKYTQQHTAGFTENNWDPVLELSILDYIFKYTQQHTAEFTDNNWDPVLELSTLDCTCSSTHNTLQVLLRTTGTQRWSYLLLTVHVQVHTTHCRFY